MRTEDQEGTFEDEVNEKAPLMKQSSSKDEQTKFEVNNDQYRFEIIIESFRLVNVIYHRMMQSS